MKPNEHFKELLYVLGNQRISSRNSHIFWGKIAEWPRRFFQKKFGHRSKNPDRLIAVRNLNFSVFLGRVALLGLMAFSVALHAQNGITNVAGEYAIIGALPGDQTMSHIAFNANGGWLVYQDNAIDGDGSGIAARHLNSTLSGDLNLFRVNQISAGEQENPQLTLLKNGGAAFVWQGGKVGFQDVFVRFMKNDGTFFGNDLQVNTYTNRDQI